MAMSECGLAALAAAGLAAAGIAAFASGILTTKPDPKIMAKSIYAACADKCNVTQTACNKPDKDANPQGGILKECVTAGDQCTDACLKANPAYAAEAEKELGKMPK